MTVGARVLGGRYRLGGVLGQGGMAVVYRAEDTMLGRTVAVKVLREQLGAEHEFLERFNREARAAARLNHPNIILVYDVGQDGPSNYIVMEYVEGHDLREQVRQHGALPTEQVVDLGCQIAAALEYAHRKGLIHRDIKTQNVLLTADGKVKVADFGIAVALGESSITADGMVVGSVHYMSPEQAEGRQTTPASDVYSLGVVLYELATGQLPFTAESPLAVARLQLQATPTPPQQVNPAVPQQLAEVILACLAKEPEPRPASAALVAAALRGQRSVNTGQQPALDATSVNPAMFGGMPPSTSGQTHRQTGPQPRQPLGTQVIQSGTVRRPLSGEQPYTSGPEAGPRTDVLMPPPRRIGERQPRDRRTGRAARHERPRRRRLWPWVVAAIVLATVGVRIGTALGERVNPMNYVQGRPTPAPVFVATPAPTPTTPAKPTAVAKPAVQPTVAPPTAVPQPTAPPQPTASPPPPATATAVPKPTTPPPPAGMKAVPGVIGRPEAEAAKLIRDAGLTVKAEERPSANAREGTVVAQDPPGDRQVLEGSTVVIVVGRGGGGGLQPKPAPKEGLVLVPNVEGMDEREARRMLEGMGFTVRVRQDNAPGRKGQVINQNPEANNSVPPKALVVITLGT
ncbi:MAG: protein kinase [Chloroflexi bacterium]|nr:protein kinase [Chloroflexota bacterium]